MTPRDYVALILAVMVFTTVVGKTLLSHFAPMQLSVDDSDTYANMATVWVDFLQVVIGGLIGYMAGRTGN